MKKYSTLCFLLFYYCAINYAQTATQYVKAAEEATEARNFAAAAEYYKTILADESHQNDADLLYRCAESYRLSNAPKQALIYFKRIKKTENLADYNRVIALVYKQLGDFANAKTYLDKIQNPSAEVQLEAAGCALAKQKTQGVAWIIEPLKSKNINSEAADYATTTSEGKLFFTSNRTEREVEFAKPKNLSGIYTYTEQKNEKQTAPKIEPIFLPSNNKTYQYASVYETKLYLAICDDDGKKCSLAAIDIEKKIENNPVFTPLPSDFDWGNSTMPFVSRQNGELTLYFASDRVGGKGGIDIWKTSLDTLKMTWGNVENMAFNTEKDEISPFFEAETNTLFFSTNGKASLGGYDVFAYHADNDVQHLPEPINSSYDDYFFFKTTDTTAYVSSTRNPQLKKGENGLCCADIYKLKTKANRPVPAPPSSTETPPIAGIPPTLPPTAAKPLVSTPLKIDSSGTPRQPSPLPQKTPVTTLVSTPPPATTLLAEPIALYFHNDEPDPDTRITTTTRNYAQTYAHYTVLRPVYLKGYCKGLSADLQQDAADKVNAFFDEKLMANYEKLGQFMKRLTESLQQGAQITIDLRGYCSPRASSDYNIRLSKRRVSCLKNYFYRYENAVLNPYLQSGKLTLHELPLGETTAPAGISDKYDDLRGSVYSPEAAQERRVEIVQVAVDVN